VLTLLRQVVVCPLSVLVPSGLATVPSSRARRFRGPGAGSSPSPWLRWRLARVG
jgi:hypothetical protein